MAKVSPLESQFFIGLAGGWAGSIFDGSGVSLANHRGLCVIRRLVWDTQSALLKQVHQNLWILRFQILHLGLSLVAWMLLSLRYSVAVDSMYFTRRAQYRNVRLCCQMLPICNKIWSKLAYLSIRKTCLNWQPSTIVWPLFPRSQTCFAAWTPETWWASSNLGLRETQVRAETTTTAFNCCASTWIAWIRAQQSLTGDSRKYLRRTPVANQIFPFPTCDPGEHSPDCGGYP